MRVHELAKELDIPSKELLEKLHELGVQAKSHMSTVDETAADLVRREHVGGAAAETPQKPVEPAAKEEKKAPPPLTDEKKEKPKAAPLEKEPVAPSAERIIKVKGSIVVKDLAEKLGLRPNQVISELMRMNVLASINERLDVNVARKIAEGHGFSLEQEKRVAEYQKKPAAKPKEEEEDRPEDLTGKPPVVTFLGHVDHGKTSLLDRIRHTAVTKEEHGGITQHIGAYTVEAGGGTITFLDTPGHEAFTAMRARGANLTDIAVLVIAADDGIMPQTREAMQHAKAADVPIMVAINKIDLPKSNVDRVKQQLQAEDLAPEDWGGQTICVPVSAQTGEGIDHLLEMILLQAEVLELKANPRRPAVGYVIEARLEPGMGPTANLLVTNGTLKIGDAVACGPYWGRVRALINDHGAKVKTACPATPVKCLGLSGVPAAGTQFRVYTDEKRARDTATQAREQEKLQQISVPRKASLDSLFSQLQEAEKLELKAIVKADTQGSVEAILHSLRQIRSDKVSLNIIYSDTGNITESDVMLASASNAVILGFHVAREPGVDSAAKHEGVDIRLHQVIYELLDEVQAAMAGLLAPAINEEIRGHAEVRQVFSMGKSGKVAGCLVTDGNVRPNYRLRVKRVDEVLFEGTMLSLKHFQDHVSEVRESQECGIRINGFSDFQEADILEFYELEEVEQTL